MKRKTATGCAVPGSGRSGAAVSGRARRTVAIIPEGANVSTVVAKFTVAGRCVAQPRVSVGRGRAYIDAEHAIHGFKQAVAVKAREAMIGRPEAGPLEARLVFAMPRLPSHTKSQDHDWHHVKPDVDNLVKAALDAAKSIVYNDDSQIVSLRALKVIVPSGGKPALYAVFLRCGEACGVVAEFLDHFNS